MNEIYKLKLTGNIHEDIDRVYDAVGYTEALVDGLVQEEMAQNNEERKRVGLFIHLLDLQMLMKKAATRVTKIRHDEEKFMYGPMADRKDL